MAHKMVDYGSIYEAILADNRQMREYITRLEKERAMIGQPGDVSVAITPLLRWALETLVIHSEPPKRPKRVEWYRARDEVAKWLDSIEPRIIERPTA